MSDDYKSQQKRWRAIGYTPPIGPGRCHTCGWHTLSPQRLREAAETLDAYFHATRSDITEYTAENMRELADLIEREG